VLYEDRVMLTVAQDAAGSWRAFYARLDRSQYDALRQRLRPTAEFLSLKSTYDLEPCIEDGPVERILLRDDDRVHGVTVRGLYLGPSPTERTVAPCETKPDDLPSEYVRFCRIMTNFVPTRLRPWWPKQFVVHLAPWENPFSEPSVPVDWPPNWIGLDGAREGPEDGVFQLVFEGDKARELEHLESQCRNGRPVRLGRRLWHLELEPVIPGSAVWEVQPNEE
jgi:hypothetical protein